MVKYLGDPLDSVFSALADPTRRGILARLSQGPASAGEVGAPFGVSRPAISRHLRVLEEAGLLHRERDGRVSRCTLESEPMLEAIEWMARYGRFWELKLDALGDHLGGSSIGGGSGRARGEAGA